MMSTSTQPKKPFHVAICGGGIGGLCMAIGLLKQNIPFTVYEAAPAFAEIGAGISFGPNSLRAMELIDPRIKHGFENCETRNGSPEERDIWFDFRIGMAEEGWKGVEKGPPVKEGEFLTEVVAKGCGQASVHRAHFLDELVKLVPKENARFGKRVEKVEERGDRLLMTFQDGTTAEADAVIGCDGIKSRTRHIVLGDDHKATLPVFTGKYAYRGLIPMEKAINAVGESLARNSQMYLGHQGHVLTFPIEKGATMNVVAFRTKKDGKWNNEKWVLPIKESDMVSDFQGWGKDIKHILSLMEKPDVWAIFDHLPAPTYYKGRLVLLGDAAHASTPHQGAGAGQAIEDAFILSNLLGDCRKVRDIESAFRAYDMVRRPRSQKVVKTSREAAELYEFENEEIAGLANGVVDMEGLKERLRERTKWIWDEDLGLQLQEARKIMKMRGERANL
ncbi:c32b138c-97f9-471c-9989-03e3b1b9f541 [Sclerotinia trifoliorum]|uniref:C32b138c-97f9-471c-9989-03e3b1b9f541 n=1 Tax=Sclerotinia trifoliorum TaxID=28548 RepID=A0A8H2VXB1_9HELO|nr:c32b138c-97f9-471c-9989-03e3b1b9f541 [Sclerotinia trifoliorum]